MKSDQEIRLTVATILSFIVLFNGCSRNLPRYL